MDKLKLRKELNVLWCGLSNRILINFFKIFKFQVELGVGLVKTQRRLPGQLVEIQICNYLICKADSALWMDSLQFPMDVGFFYKI